MLSKQRILFIVGVLALIAGIGLYQKGSTSDKAPAEHDEADANHEESATLSDIAVKNLGIEVLQSGNATITETMSVSGRIVLNQNTSSQVKARFPGLIRSVVKEPGELVEAGDILATVESNDSLQVYPVKAPMRGTVISRNANVGETAADVPLFVIADLSKLWAELHVFSKDQEHVSVGQKVRVVCLDDPVLTDSTISLVLPTTDASSQTVIARSVVDNANNHWRAGMNIRGEIVISEVQVPLAVKANAIQRMENQTVVFVQEGQTYKAQPVATGRTDSEWVEITGGLQAGQSYVAKNSFVIKAEIGKAGAEHED